MLPAQWPVLLCNGAVGIAEGWATKVPAHNPREVMAACRALLARPNMTDDRLVKLIPGPDWGCGATVVGTAGLREYMTTGRGSVHGAWHGIRRRKERRHHRAAARCCE